MSRAFASTVSFFRINNPEHLMKSISLVSLALILAASASAQAFTSPPGFLSKEGVGPQPGWSIGYAYLYFGTYANERFQHADGEHKGKGLKIVTAVGYRLDWRNHSATTAVGRKWSNVTLKMSECDFTKLSRTWAANPTTTQTQVFNSAVSWPTQTGNPSAAAPAPWDSKLRFPFTGTWIYTGKQDILHDYVFTNGTMSNSAAWAGSTRQQYYLDGIFIATSMVTGRSLMPSNSTCNDSAITTTRAADANVQYAQYSKAYTGTNANIWTDKVVIQSWSERTAPNAAVIQAVGIAALNGGVGTPFPGSCHNLIIDLNAGAIYLNHTTNAAGNVSPWTHLVAGPRSVVNAVKGLRVWTQAAWNDSKTKIFTLTRASRTQAPNLGMTDRIPLKKVNYNWNPTATTGLFSSFSNSWTAVPLIRYN
jgi:hypothetical protein